jgi:opacity protein-like surface antigen
MMSMPSLSTARADGRSDAARHQDLAHPPQISLFRQTGTVHEDTHHRRASRVEHLAGAAQAQNTGPYITFEGGALKNERTDFRSGNGYEHSDTFKTGWEAGGALGYDFGHFRAEIEGFYHEADLRRQTRPAGTPLPNGVFDRSNGLSGNSNSRAVMANGLFGLGHWGGVKLYAGGGAGYARTFVSDSVTGGGLIQGHSQGLAWQALGGLTVPISRTIDLGVKYRYFRPDGAEDFNYSGGGTRHASLRSHSLLATLTFNFGRPASEPVQEVPPHRRRLRHRRLRLLRRLPHPRRRLRLPATPGPSSCSSIGTARISATRAPPFWTARSRPMVPAATCGSCWPATRTVRARRDTTWALPNAAIGRCKAI